MTEVSEIMTIDLTPIVEAIIALLAAVITAYALPWLKAKLGNEKFNQLSSWAAVAVQAAEEIFAYSEAGAEKKAYVTQFISEIGLKPDNESLDKLIEAEVYKLGKKE